MQITDGNQLLKLEGNRFIGTIPKLINSQINFKGKNNILICQENVKLWNSRIDFNLDNSVLYLSSNLHDYSVNISVHNNNVCFIGKDNFFNGRTTIVLSEGKNVIIGDGCLFSYNITIRVADGHLLYNSDTKERLNQSKSIFIGDHVWLGQNAMIFKGTQIGSGSTIGANSVLSNKTVPSNTTFAGSPVKLIHNNSFWTGHSVHGWVDEETEKMAKYESDRFIYNVDENTMDFEDIDHNFNNLTIPYDIFEYIHYNIVLNHNKNKFSIKR